MATHAGELSTRTAAAVEVRDLHRSFNEAGGVLNGLDLDIAPGEFVALLGRSGSRQEHAAAGARRPRPRRRRLRADPRAREGVGGLPGLPAAAVEARARQRRASACAARDAAERGREALAEVGLAGREKAWPHELSGGEQQRAALARSLVRDPELLLADEPFGALDALTRIRMHTLLRKLCERHQPAVLLVTHDVDEAIVLADRVIVLDDGVVRRDVRIELDRPPRRRPTRRSPRLRARLLDRARRRGRRRRRRRPPSTPRPRARGRPHDPAAAPQRCS